jgi:hypothetical protein
MRITIGVKVRQWANKLAERVGPSERAAGLSKADVVRSRATIRDAALAGYELGVEATLRALAATMDDPRRMVGINTQAERVIERMEGDES